MPTKYTNPKEKPKGSTRESPQDFAEAYGKFQEENRPDGKDTRWGPKAFLIFRKNNDEKQPPDPALPG